MPTICIQCALEELVKNKNPDAMKYGVFEESPEAHMKRVHPNGIDPEKRKQLEERAQKIIAKKGRRL